MKRRRSPTPTETYQGVGSALRRAYRPDEAADATLDRLIARLEKLDGGKGDGND